METGASAGSLLHIMRATGGSFCLDRGGVLADIQIPPLAFFKLRFLVGEISLVMVAYGLETRNRDGTRKEFLYFYEEDYDN